MCFIWLFVCVILLPPWSGVFFSEANRFSASHEFPTFYGTRRFITTFKSARYLSLSWARSIQSMPDPTSWRSILILFSHPRLRLPSGLSPSGFPTKTRCTPLTAPHSEKNKSVSIKLQYVPTKLQSVGWTRVRAFGALQYWNGESVSSLGYPCMPALYCCVVLRMFVRNQEFVMCSKFQVLILDDTRARAHTHISSFYQSFQTTDATMLKSQLAQVMICTNITTTRNHSGNFLATPHLRPCDRQTSAEVHQVSKVSELILTGTGVRDRWSTNCLQQTCTIKQTGLYLPNWTYSLGLTSCTHAAAWRTTSNNAAIRPNPGRNTVACFSNMALQRNLHHLYSPVLSVPEKTKEGKGKWRCDDIKSPLSA